MRRVLILFLISAALLSLAAAGCQHGDFKAAPVLQGSPAPFDGYNIGPELYVHQGDPVPVTGAVIWIRGLEPAEMRRLDGQLQGN